jgi:hypothetical protein
VKVLDTTQYWLLSVLSCRSLPNEAGFWLFFGFFTHSGRIVGRMSAKSFRRETVVLCILRCCTHWYHALCSRFGWRIWFWRCLTLW